MQTFVFRCPSTGYNVQGSFEESNSPLPTYVGQHCLACRRLHIVDPRNGRLLAERQPASASPPRHIEELR
jgi:hypothetical protein